MSKYDFSYDAEALDRQVMAPDQIRTVLTAFRDSLPELFPGRTETPKTLIFAKDDSHAEDIVRIAREVFGRGDDFCQKITYRAAGQPENLISAFRNAYNPRVAVTVDMIATGTDIKPLEALVFMRAVRSRLLFEQMLGRGTRVVSDTDFQAVTATPNAHKTRFVIVDAVGVTEQELAETVSLERKRSAPLKALLEAAAVGAVDEDVCTSLARRLSLMENRLSPAQRQQVETLLDVPAAPRRFASLRELANALLDAADPDAALAHAARSGSPCPTPEQVEAARRELLDRAVIPLAASPELRAFLLDREILIDETSRDELLQAGFDGDAAARARQLVDSFQTFIQDHRDEIAALQIIYSRPYAQRRLDYAQVRDLAEALNQALHQPGPLYLTEALWGAYQQLEKDRVRGAGQPRLMADLVALVRHAVLHEELEPFAGQVERRYRDWLDAQAAAGRQFTPQQRWWLDELARQIGINLSVSLDDLNAYSFQQRGGQVAAQRLFGARLQPLLDELNSVLGV